MFVNNFLAPLQVLIVTKLHKSYLWPQGTRWLNFGRSKVGREVCTLLNALLVGTVFIHVSLGTGWLATCVTELYFGFLQHCIFFWWCFLMWIRVNKLACISSCHSTWFEHAVWNLLPNFLHSLLLRGLCLGEIWKQLHCSR